MNTNINYNNIPAELKALPQWMAFEVVPDPEKPGKLKKTPYIAQRGIVQKASPTDPTHCRDFATALDFCQQAPTVLFMGLQMRDTDPYCVIDLDNPVNEAVAKMHTNVMAYFSETYQERSVSGTGFHIICKAPPVAGINCRARSAEIYTKERMLIFTGDVTANAGIQDRRTDVFELMDDLRKVQQEQAEARADYTAEKSHLSPTDVLVMATKNHNYKGKIFRLIAGNFTAEDIQDESGNDDFSGTTGKLMVAIACEANLLDNELLKHAFFQTKWFNSATYQNHYKDTNRHKINKQHATHWARETATAIGRAQQQLAAKAAKQGIGAQSGDALVAAFKSEQAANSIDAHEEAQAAMLAHVEPEEETEEETPELEEDRYGIPVIKTDEDHWQRPPGDLLTEMIEFFLRVSHRPNRAVCVAAAITTLSGWCGSRFQTNTGAGLTFYGLLFGKSGIGKSDCQTTHNALVQAIRMEPNNQAFADIFLENHTIPGRHTGGAAIRRRLGDIYEKNHNTVSVSMFCEEVGNVISGAMKQGSNSRDFIDLIYDMFTSAGQNSGLASKLYANDENTVSNLNSANLAFLGEGTKESVFENLSVDELDKGLFPRFSYVDCGDKKPRGNKTKLYAEDCPDSLVQLCLLTMTEVKKLEERNLYKAIPANHDAQQWLDIFEDAVDDYTDKLENNDPARVMYNRHYLITLRLSCLAAISKNPKNPKIDMECVTWAQAFTNNSMKVVLTTMHEEKMKGFGKRQVSVAEALTLYLDKTTVGKSKSDNRTKSLIEQGFIRWSDLTNLSSRKGFKEEEATRFKTCAVLAREVLSEFQELGILEKVDFIEVTAVVKVAKGGTYYRMTPEGYTMLKQIKKWT